MDDLEMKDRLKALRKALKINQETFAQRLGVARNTIANYETGHRTPMNAMLQSICREFNVDFLWLTTGEGEMFHQTNNDTMACIDELLAGEDTFVKNVFRAFAKLPAEDWQQLERILKKLLAEMHSEEPKDGEKA